MHQTISYTCEHCIARATNDRNTLLAALRSLGARRYRIVMRAVRSGKSESAIRFFLSYCGVETLMVGAFSRRYGREA